MKKAIFSLLLMAASVIGASAQGNATAQNPQDVDVLYAKNLLASGTEAPASPGALKKDQIAPHALKGQKLLAQGNTLG